MIVSPYGPFLMAPGGSRNAPFIAYGSGVTWNPSDKSADLTLSGGNLIVQSARTDTGKRNVRATAGVTTGCWYWEVKFSQLDNDSDHLFGFGNGSFDLESFLGGNATACAVSGNGGGGAFETGTYTVANSTTFPTMSLNDIGMVCLDMTLGYAWFGRNGTWIAGNPSLRTTPIITGITGTVYPAVSIKGSGGGTTGGDRLTANFGATAFSYTPPT